MKKWLICKSEDQYKYSLAKCDSQEIPILCIEAWQERCVISSTSNFKCTYKLFDRSSLDNIKRNNGVGLVFNDVLEINIDHKILKNYFSKRTNYYTSANSISNSKVEKVLIVSFCNTREDAALVRREIATLQRNNIVIEVIIGRDWSDISWQLAKAMTDFKKDNSDLCIINAVDNQFKEQSDKNGDFFNRESNPQKIAGSWNRVYLSAHGSGERLYIGTDTIGYNDSCSISAKEFFSRVVGNTLIVNSCFSFSLKDGALFWGLIWTSYKHIMLYDGIKENSTIDIDWFRILDDFQISCDYATYYVNKQLNAISSDFGNYYYFGISDTKGKPKLSCGIEYINKGIKLEAKNQINKKLGFCKKEYSGFLQSNKNIKWIYANGYYLFSTYDNSSLPKVLFISDFSKVINRSKQIISILLRRLITFPSNPQMQKSIFTNIVACLSTTNYLTSAWQSSSDLYKGQNKLLTIEKQVNKVIEQNSNLFRKNAMETNAPYSDKYLVDRFTCTKKIQKDLNCPFCASKLQIKIFESPIEPTEKRYLTMCPSCGQLKDTNLEKMQYPVIKDNIIKIKLQKNLHYWITVVGYKIAEHQELILHNLYSGREILQLLIPKKYTRVCIGINSEVEDSFITVLLNKE